MEFHSNYLVEVELNFHLRGDSTFLLFGGSGNGVIPHLLIGGSGKIIFFFVFFFKGWPISTSEIPRRAGSGYQGSLPSGDEADEASNHSVKRVCQIPASPSVGNGEL